MPPEFFLDRNLGRRVAEELRARGWTVHRIVDVFPADAQDIPDEEWIAHGLAQSWVPLSKDGRIKTRDVEIQPVLDHEAALFYLDNQQLRSSDMVERLDARRAEIYQAVTKGGPAAYAVRHDRIECTWP
ncbi:PIN-like domain-containing protein [Streptomyces lincolnensis]|uniref:PIN-like domain-containing protein n=1 Tax=Streptomyces lincolnensis TaxID=1915 RepID=UPI0037D60666